VLEPLPAGQTLTLLGKNLDQVSEVLFAANFPAAVVAEVPPLTGEILEQSPTRLRVNPPPDLALTTTAVAVHNSSRAGLGRLDITWKPATTSSPPSVSPSSNFWRVQTVAIDNSALVSPGLPESPRAVAADPEGGFYIADQERHQILHLSLEGKLKLWAGTGQPGSKDGPATEAQFHRPVGLALDQDGSLLVVDQGNHQIRRISRSGQVSTVAGAPSPGFVDGERFRARFRSPSDLVVTPEGGILVADSGNHRIRYIQPTGDVVTLAGSGQKGFRDGPALEASFDTPTGLALASDSTLWIADQGNHRIRRLNRSKEVETVAGEEAGFADGIQENARFQLPTALEIDDKGILYIADQGNHRIRQLGPEKTVTTLAGSGEAGQRDGSSGQAQFQAPVDLYWGEDGSMIIADQESSRLRQIAPVPTQIGGLPVAR
jgi:DNA-binding beta-propeller fold protein YncE